MFADQVTNYLQTVNAVSTRHAYRFALQQFHDWYVAVYDGEPNVNMLTKEIVREWRTHLSDVKELSAATINQRLAALRGIARQNGRLLDVKGVKKAESLIEPLSSREIEQLITALNGERWLDRRNVAIVSLMVRAGLRVSEVVALPDDDLEISPHEGHITVRQGIGSRERIVPLSHKARIELQTYCKARPSFANQWLFVSRSGLQLASRDVQRLVNKASLKAGIKKQVTPHVLRHSFAARALQQTNMDLITLSRILGHENLTATAKYWHSEQVKIAAEMLEEL